MAKLARQLSLWNYFALGFGTMIGTGWIIVMDDWLGRGGPLGAMLGFALGGILLLPVGYIYGQWVARLPDAAGEAAYTAQVFPPFVSYMTGWMMLLAYFIVCPWEAVAIGKLASYIFPALDTIRLYSVGGEPVFLPRLIVGIAMTVLLGYLNYRGVKASGVFQNWATSLVILVFLLLVAVSIGKGSAQNLKPVLGHAPLVSILLTLQIVPYFLTGYESVPKVAEEAHPGFRAQDFFKAIVMALLIATGFLVLSIGAVSYIVPWQSLLGKRFATVIAFQEATHSTWLVRLILAIAFVALFQVFNGNFVAATRLLFAFGRRGTIPARFGAVHPRYLSPGFAIFAACLGTVTGLFIGDALLVPVSEVGAMAASFGWLAACVSFFLVESNMRLRLIAAMGIAISLLLTLMKFLPIFPGHFTRAEWIALACWIALGLLFRRGGHPA